MLGKRIAILESRLGTELAALVARRGGVPLHAPALAEQPDVDPAQIAALVGSLQTQPAQLAVFQTGVGTRALFAATDALGLTPQFLALLHVMRVAVRGPKPAGALRARAVRIDYSAAEPFTTRELLACTRDLEVAGARVIVQRHGAANPELEGALQARGADVAEIPTYRWSLPPDSGPLERLIARLELGEVDAVVVTNAAQARNLVAVAERLGRAAPLRAALNRTLVASIGPVASAALRDAGVGVGLEARPPKMGALLSSLEEALSGR